MRLFLVFVITSLLLACSNSVGPETPDEMRVELKQDSLPGMLRVKPTNASVTLGTNAPLSLDREHPSMKVQIDYSFSIGRDSSSELPLTLDKFISRHHAKIFLNDNECVLEDLNSTNGTFVDNSRLSGKTRLSKGQIFRVGRTWLQIAW